MSVKALVLGTAAATLEQLFQWKYGVVGIVALLLLVIGIKVRNHTCSSIGAVALALMVSKPAL
ncbi:hypothetical protein ABZ322_09105 [Streptomyces sp. NPDC006129]|uniref:hypothetical protein n=1 Tax=unclassified Streptomyces TaxID=2593676 RepID=UPI00332AFF06